MEQLDLYPEFESPHLIESNIYVLARRLTAIDPNALTRLEKIMHRVRIERVVERNAEKPVNLPNNPFGRKF